MTKIVYNACYGGFSLSDAAIMRYAELTGLPLTDKNKYIWRRDIRRDDPILAQVVEELGDQADGFCASLAIVELPVGTKYRIDEYDGYESVMTLDDYKWSTA